MGHTAEVPLPLLWKSTPLIVVILPEHTVAVILRSLFLVRNMFCVISTAQPSVSTHMENRRNYIRMPFVALSSAFNTISPMTLSGTCHTPGLSTTHRNWILDFLTQQTPTVWRSHLLYVSTQHRSPPGLCTRPPPVHTLHP